MDRFAARMIAGGPTLVADGPTGSVHIVDLADAAAAREFAFDEPGYQAGAYRDGVATALAKSARPQDVGLRWRSRRRSPVPRTRARLRAAGRHLASSRCARADRLWSAALRRRHGLGRDGGLGWCDRPGDGAIHPDARQVCGDRGARLGIWREAVLTSGVSHDRGVRGTVLTLTLSSVGPAARHKAITEHRHIAMRFTRWRQGPTAFRMPRPRRCPFKGRAARQPS